MSSSIIDLQRDIILHTLRETGRDERDVYKILVCDRDSRKLLNNVVKEDAVLSLNIIEIEQIEIERHQQLDTWAIYLLSPLPHIIKCLRADLDRRRYKHCHVIWTSQVHQEVRKEMDYRKDGLIHTMKELNIDFFPRESHLVSFQRDWSFQVLYNPAYNDKVRRHMEALAQQIVSVCVAMGEYPLVRYYRPDGDKEKLYDAAVLCGHLARFVQEALDKHASKSGSNFPPQSPLSQQRPRAILVITDRSMDLMAPLIHELTYQAMAMDLLPMQEAEDKVSYLNVVRRGQPDQEEKLVELNEDDKIWVGKRHLHMKDLLVQLSDDFHKFQAKNPQFAESGQSVSVNTIKDMLAGLPEFQEGKEAFSLHIGMAEKCVKIFQDRRLFDVTSVEQSLATGQDENGKASRTLTDQIVQLLPDPNVMLQDRMRLLTMYILNRGAILEKDIQMLQKHGELSEEDYKAICHLQLLGARIIKTREELELGVKFGYAPSFPQGAPQPVATGEEVSLSRYKTAVEYMLERLCDGTLNSGKDDENPDKRLGKRPTQFPFAGKQLDNSAAMQTNTAQASLRVQPSVQPTWTTSKRSVTPRQRIIVFMAGGATYSEACACYNISKTKQKEVYLASTHMWTPKTFLRQIYQLDASEEQLGLKIDKQGELPRWVREPPPEAMKPQQPQPSQYRPSSSRPPTEAMQNVNLGPPRQSNGSSRPSSSQKPTPPTTSGSSFATPMDLANSGKLKKDKKEKKGHLGGLFRKH